MTRAGRLFLVWGAYPGVMVACLWIYFTMIAAGFNATPSSYVSAMFGGLGLITGLEFILPYRRHWAPTRSEIGTDLVFMALVQILLPSLLSLISAVGLAAFWARLGLAPDAFWPHRYPVWVQVFIFMFGADFLR